MSYYWENTVWQNADGTWGIGFYSRVSHSGSHDYDSEWADDYDYEHFAAAANGFHSAEAAMDWQGWKGANPGSYNVQSEKLTVKETKDAADMVRAANDSVFSRELDERREKEKSLAFIKEVRAKLRANEPVENKRYNIRLSLDKIPASTGLMRDYRQTTLKKDGDWLGFEDTTRLKNGKTRKAFIKVWNTKTRSQPKNIVWVEEDTARVWR